MRRISVEAVIFDRAGCVLLVKQGQQGRGWELPGGKVKKREGILDALAREVREETGLRVVAKRLIGVFDIAAESFVDLVLVCGIKSGKLKAKKPEIKDVRFWRVDRLPKSARPFTRARIRDAMRGVTHPLPVALKPGDWVA